MTNIVYVSPTDEWSIQEVKFDLKWYDLLSEKVESPSKRFYGVCRKSNNEWTIYRFPEPPTEFRCFQWLLSKRIISKDEFDKRTERYFTLDKK